jgi:anti-sigma B factor antagonist
MKLESTHVGQVVVLHLHGKMVGPDEYVNLHDSLDEFALQSRMNVVIDMTNVPFIDSTGVGALMRALFAFRRRGGRLKFCGLNKRVDDVFYTIDLRNIFHVYDTQLDAVSAFAFEAVEPRSEQAQAEGGDVRGDGGSPER